MVLKYNCKMKSDRQNPWHLLPGLARSLRRLSGAVDDARCMSDIGWDELCAPQHHSHPLAPATCRGTRSPRKGCYPLFPLHPIYANSTHHLSSFSPRSLSVKNAAVVMVVPSGYRIRYAFPETEEPDATCFMNSSAVVTLDFAFECLRLR